MFKFTIDTNARRSEAEPAAENVHSMVNLADNISAPSSSAAAYDSLPVSSTTPHSSRGADGLDFVILLHKQTAKLRR